MKLTKKHLIHIAAFLIPVLCVFIGLIAGGFAPFGSKDVLTAGGMSKYIPYFNELYARVHHDAASGYALTEGLGYDFTKVVAYCISDPINLIVLIFPKAAMLSVLNILYMLKAGAAGMIFSIFLSERKLSIAKDSDEMFESKKQEIEAYEKRLEEKKAAKAKKEDFKIGGQEEPKTAFGKLLQELDLTNLAFSVAYALSGYMLGMGLNVTLLGVVAIFPLLILGIDRIVSEKKFKLYLIALIISFFMNFYLTMVVSLFLLFYFSMQKFENAKHVFTSLGIKILCDAGAFGVAGIVTISSVTSKLFADEISLEFIYSDMVTNLFDVFKMLYHGTLPSSASNYTSGIDIFASVLALFALVLYITNKNINVVKKIKSLVMLAVTFAALFLTTLNYLFNFFKYSDYNFCAFGFIFVFLILVIGYEAVYNVRFTTNANVIAALISVFALVAATMFFAKNYESISPFLTTLELLFLYFFIFLLLKNGNMTKLVFVTSLAVVMILDSGSAYISSMKYVGALSSSYKSQLEHEYEATKDYLLSKYPSAKIKTFSEDTDTSNPVSNMINGYDFVICENGTQYIDTGLNFVETKNGIDIYENPYSLKNGFYTNNNIDNYSYSPSYAFTSLNLLSTECMDAKELFHDETGEFDYDQGELYDLSGNKITELTQVSFIFTPLNAGDYYASILRNVHIGEAAANSPISYYHNFTNRELTTYKFSVKYVSFDKDAYEELYNTENETCTIEISDKTSSTLQVSVDSKKDGYVLIPVDYYKNWSYSASSDSAKTDANTLLIDGTYFVKLPVTAGINSFTLMRSNTDLIFTLIISVLCLIVMIVILVMIRNRAADSTDDSKNPDASVNSEKKWYDKIFDFIDDNRVYFLLFLIVTVAFVLILMYQVCAPFGTNSAVASDGYAQSFPFTTEFFEKIKSGKSGLLNYGSSIMTDNYLGMLGLSVYPTNWLYMLFPGEYSMVAFTFINYISITFIPMALVFYLTHRPNQKCMDKHDLRLVIFGLAYAFNSFVISYFSFTSFYGFAIFMPFLILGLEQLVYEKKYGFYVIALTYVMFSSTYNAFLMCEFLFCYFFVLKFDDVKHFFTSALKFGGFSILSALMSCFSLLPFYLFTKESAYTSTDAIPSFSLGNTLIDSFRDLSVMSLPVVVTSDNTAANTYFGIIILLFLAVYAMNKKIDLSVRIRKLLLVFVLYFAYGNDFLNYVFHGFHLQSNVPNRFAIFLIFVVISMFYDCIVYKEEKLDKKSIIAFISWSALVLGITIYNTINQISMSGFVTIALIVIYVLVVILMNHTSSIKTRNNVLFALLIIELLMNTCYTANASFGIHITSDSEDSAAIRELSEEYGMTDELCRTEYVGSVYDNAAALFNVNSFSGFTSNLTGAHRDVGYKWNIVSSTNNIEYNNGNPLAATMLNVKYLITNDYYDDQSVPDYFTLLVKRDNISIYENPYAVGSGIFFSEETDVSDIQSKDFTDLFSYENAISNKLTGKDLYTTITFETEEANLTDESSYCLVDTDSITKDTTEINAYITTGTSISGDVYITYMGFLIFIGHADFGKTNDFEVILPISSESKNNEVKLAVVEDSVVEEIYNKLSSSAMTNVTTTSNKVYGHVNATTDGTVYISLPKLSGWTAYVDGVKTEIVSYNGAIGIPVNAGEHDITLIYQTAGLKLGIIISLSALALTILIFYLMKKLSNKSVDESVD